MNGATLIGFGAILMWSLLATFTALSGTMKPFQLNAIAFFIGALPGVVGWILNPQSLNALRQPKSVWLIGICGLFGYHFFYFTSLRSAPPVAAGLINYLWPLLIVLGSALMPGERLRWYHIIGAALGFSGTILIILGKGDFGLKSEYSFGYLMALIGAFTWAAYSLLSRRVAKVSTSIVAAFCLATSALSLICHIVFQEPTIWPQDTIQWAALVGLGLFPVGLAFYCWDYGVKHGNIQLLGVASYAAPILSTLLLIASGVGAPSWQLAVACLLITVGAIIASKDIIGRNLSRRKMG